MIFLRGSATIHVAAKLLAVLIAVIFLYPAAAQAILSIGDSANRVKLTDGGGKETTFPMLGEKTLVVVFWYPKCEPCVAEMKKLSANLKGADSEGVGVVAVTRGKDDKERSEAKGLLEDIDKRFVSMYDPDFSVASKYFNASNPPLFFIIDKSGRLRTSGISVTGAPVRNLALLDFVGLVKKGETVPLIELVPKPNAKEYPAAALIGKKAPEIPPLKDMKGNIHSTEKYAGDKNLMVVFWSVRCPHCKRELPRLQSFYLAHAREFDMELLSIAYSTDDKTTDEIEQFVKDNQITFPIIIGGKEDLMSSYKVRGVPCVFIVSREGKIVEMLAGERDDIEQVLDSVFRTDPALRKPRK